LFAPGCPDEPDAPPVRESPEPVLGVPPAGLPLAGEPLPAVEADPCDGGVGQPCGRGGGGVPLPLLPSPCAEPDEGLGGDDVDGEPEGAWLPEPPPELVGELEGIELDEPPELEGVDGLEEPPGLDGIEDPEEPPEVDGVGLLEGMEGEGGIVLGIEVELVVTQPPAATAAATSSKVVIPWIRCIRCPLRWRVRQARFALGWIRAAPGGSISASHCCLRRRPQRRLALQRPCRRLRGRTAAAR
jgi:hypothetical protein